MEENKEKFTTRFGKFHDRHYKHLLLIPLIIFIFCFVYAGIFYSNTGDFIYRDISLTGGTSVTIYENVNLNDLEHSLSEQLQSLNVREISDLITGEQVAVVVETSSGAQTTRNTLENYLGHPLTEENSSFEFTGSLLSRDFFKQLILAVITAFLFMGWVVFVIFGKKSSHKIITGLISIIPFLILFFSNIQINPMLYLSLSALVITFGFYSRYSIPSVAVIISAFANIFMTLTLFNILGMEMSTAGIIAFLMLIGYSVDTDILLTSRVLKRQESHVNEKLYSAFKTGITMTLTSLFALLAALLIVRSFSVVLTAILTVLVIGLSFDLINTWITNVSILKWYVEKNSRQRSVE